MTYDKDDPVGDHEDARYDDDFTWDSSTSPSTWKKIRSTADRVVTRTLDVAGDIAQRGLIEVEIASLRVRLRTLYSRLGEIVFRMRAAEERDDIFSDPEVQALFDQIQATHSEIASERQRLEKLREMAHRDDYAGA